MNRGRWHPEDFSPYLDRDSTDPACERIREHLAGCDICRQEVAQWESVDSLFRSPDLDLEVPAFQWQRISSLIASHGPVSSWRSAATAFLTRPRLVARYAAMAAGVLALLVFAGFEYRRYAFDQRILAEIRREGTSTIQVPIGANPFENYLKTSGEGNPFMSLDEDSNPFRARQ